MSQKYKKQYEKKPDTSFFGTYVSPVIETVSQQFVSRKQTLTGKKPYNNSQTGRYSSN